MHVVEIAMKRHVWTCMAWRKPCKHLHGVDIFMQRLTSNTMGYPIPWALKPLTVNPTMTESVTL